MKSEKIKVFLGAYINQSNAQNLNCLTLAKYIDKEKFDVYTLAIKHGNFGKITIPGVKIFTCNYPVKFTQYLGFLWGIWKCDVTYLPRGNAFKWQSFLSKLLNKKSFKTIERIIDKDEPDFIFKDYNTLIENFQFTDRLYSITHFMKTYHEKHHSLASEELILPLATDTDHFNLQIDEVDQLSDIVFIGNHMKRKGIDDYLFLASRFPNIIFHVIGRDSLGFFKKNDYKPNVVYHGMLNHDKMIEVLKICQLNILPSRSEGFPRGIIECAAAGLPTLTYSDYGANEWITNFKNGYVGQKKDDFVKVINTFIDDVKLLNLNRKGVQQLADKFSAKKIVNLYENVILDLVN